MFSVFLVFCHFLRLHVMIVVWQKRNYNQGKHRINSRTSMAQREEVIRRTVYVSDIDIQVRF